MGLGNGGPGRAHRMRPEQGADRLVRLGCSRPAHDRLSAPDRRV